MGERYDTDVSDVGWAVIEPHLPPAKPGGRPRSTDLRAVVNAIFSLIRRGCQWRLLPRCFPPWSTVHHYFRAWNRAGVWTRLHRAADRLVRAAAGRGACPTVVIMDGQSVTTTERGGSRGFDGHKRVKGRKRHVLVDTLGRLVASRVEPAGMSDRRAGARLVYGLAPLWPEIHTIIADAGHASRRLARLLREDAGWDLRIVKRRARACKITGLTWIPDQVRDQAHLRMAGPKPSFQQALRVQGADLGNADQNRRDQAYARPPGCLSRLLAHPLTKPSA